MSAHRRLALGMFALFALAGCDCSSGVEPRTDEQEFWELIDSARRGRDEHHACEYMVMQLSRGPDSRVLGFERWLWVLLARSYTEEMWGAAYLINGGASDDAFEYFRLWLILRGREVFDAALANPDSLADHVRPGLIPEAEELLYVASMAAEARGTDVLEAEEGLPYPEIEWTFNFDDDDAMRTRYPRLWRTVMGDQ